MSFQKWRHIWAGDDAKTHIPSDTRAGILGKQACGGAGRPSRSFLSPSWTPPSSQHSLVRHTLPSSQGRKHRVTVSIQAPQTESPCRGLHLPCLPTQWYLCSMLTLWIFFLSFFFCMLQRCLQTLVWGSAKPTASEMLYGLMTLFCC